MQDRSDTARLEHVVRALDGRAVLRRTWPLKGGISSRMTVLEFVVGNATQRVVLRQPEGALHENPLAVANEFRLLRLLKSAGLPTPTPLLVDESGDLLPAPYLVIEYIDGASDFATLNRREALTQLAAHLAAIHRVDFVDTELELLPAYVPRFVHQRDSAYPDGSLGAAGIRDALNRTWQPRPKNRPALLHGDYWPGNVLWKDGMLVGIVDWEESCIGDPIADLAITRLDLLWAFGVTPMQEFTELYASASGFDVSDLPYWDLDAALRPVFNIHEWAIAWPDLDRPDVTEATMRADHRRFVARAFDALREAR